MDDEVGQRRPRRPPAPGERKRDPERTRERILNAAVVEFGEHGYAGARISAIAARAGVQQQLISYYFEGKAGLYAALTQRWRAMRAGISPAESSLAEVAVNLLRTSVEQRHWSRLLAWEGLTGDVEGGDPTHHDESTDGFFPALLAEVRRRQSAGELAPDLDAAYVLLVLFAAAMAPTLLPQVARRITGQRPESAEFVDAYADQLRLIIDRLGSLR